MVTPSSGVPAAQGSSFAKGLSVLTWIMDHDEPRADLIADALGLPLSTVYRYLRTLRESGLAVEEDGVYAPGPRLGPFLRTVPAASIGEMAAPFLKFLSAATGETAVLTVRHGMHAACVRQVESPHEIRLAFRLGQLLPLYAGAGQRVLLAFAPEEVQRAVIQSELRPLTPDTPTRAELTRLLARIRAEGVAVSRGEVITGSFALAVPVLVERHAVAGLCVAGPRNRCGSTWQQTAHRELAGAARSLAAALGETDTAR